MLITLLSCSTFSGSKSSTKALEPGTTMFGLSYPVNAQQILEVDDEGETVWSFMLTPEIFLHEGALGPSMLMDVEPLANGNVLFTVFPGGVYEIDRKGVIVWYHLDEAASHDSDRLPNGNTLIARTWAKKGEKQIIELDRDGNEVWAWNGMHAFAEDPRFAELSDEGDAWMHITSVDRAVDGSTRMCIRNFNQVVTVSAEGKVENDFTLQSMPNSSVAQTTGKLVGERPHGAEWFDDKHFLLATRRPQKVVEIDNGKVAWKFSHPDISGARDIDRLPGGNTLITSKDRIVEVDPDGAILWQWTLPSPPDKSLSWNELHPLMSVTRIGPDGKIVDRD